MGDLIPIEKTLLQYISLDFSTKIFKNSSSEKLIYFKVTIPPNGIASHPAIPASITLTNPLRPPRVPVQNIKEYRNTNAVMNIFLFHSLRAHYKRRAY